MKILFTLFFSFLFFVATAQVPEPNMLWLQVIEGNCSISSCVSPQLDGGFIVEMFATSTNLGNVDSLCALRVDRTIFQKYNSDASIIEWSKCYAGNFSDSGFFYMSSTSDGGYILGGIGNGETHKFLIHKEDATGAILWSKSYGDSAEAILESMVATDDGGYIMLGETYYTETDFPIHYGDFNADIGVIKVDSLGNKIWSRVIGGSGDESPCAVVKGPDNGCYIIGTTSSDDYDCMGNHGDSSGSTDAYLVRLDANGNIMWHKDLGGTGYDQGNYGCTDGKGGIIIGATSGSNNGDVTNQINANGYNIWAINIDSNGNILWNNCYGGGGDEFTNSICKAIDGSIWIACTNANRDSFEVDTFYGGNYDAWFVHADSIGNFLSAKVLGSHQQDEGFMVYPLSNGNVIAGGYYDTTGCSFPFISWGGGGSFISVFAPSTTGVAPLQRVNNAMRIYPNPGNEEVTIMTKNQGSSELIITDVIGKEVYKSELNDKIQVQVKDWQKGIYFVQVIGEDGYKEVQKLIVE